jgi:hypothetical protein
MVGLSFDILNPQGVGVFENIHPITAMAVARQALQGGAG